MKENSKHYIYKITNLKNNKIYIGLRTHPKPENDEYMGSGTCIKKVIEIEGLANFKKEIILVFDTRKEASLYESNLLTEEFVNDPNNYNISRNNWNEGNFCFRKDLWYDYYDEIRNKYKKGSSFEILGKYYKCGSNTIRCICSDIKNTRFRPKSIVNNQKLKEFDEKYLEEIIKLYNVDKWSVTRIADSLETSTSVINYRLKSLNIPKRKRQDNNEKPKNRSRQDVWDQSINIIKLYKKGININDLSKKYKCSQKTIQLLLKFHQIKINKRGDNIANLNRKKVFNLLDDGYTKPEIHKKVNIGLAIITKLYNEYYKKPNGL